MATLNQAVTFIHERGTAGQLAVPSLSAGDHYGVVVSTNPQANTVEVMIDGLDQKVPAVWAAGFFSGLLGFKTSFLPAIGTRVLLHYSGRALSLIIAAFPEPLVDPGLQLRSATDPTNATNYSQTQAHAVKGSTKAHGMISHKPPVDLVEGEFQIDNMLGVGLQLLRHMSALSAGDLSRIECHILDDMVRIISENFNHHTAFGDYRVANDGGKLKVTWNGTSHEHEAWGLLRPQDAKAAAVKDGRPDELNFAELKGNEEGRWRFSQYIGWLGDFINLYVTDPVNAIGQLAEQQVRSGKFRCHVNTDGSLLVQSVGDIVLEKVVRIPVPVQIRREDDPDGNRTDDSSRDNPYLQTWRPTDSEHIFEMAFQLRQYARWFNNAYSLGRFRSQDRDFRVPSETETPAPDVSTSDEADKAKVNTGVANHVLAYATIRIYRDGSIQWVDAYGNSMTSTKIGVQISSTSDLLLQAAGSVNIVAGRDINMLAKHNVGITASLEKVRIRAQTGLYLLTVLGNTVLEAVAGFFVKITGVLNVNNGLQVNRAGDTHVKQPLTAQRFIATSSLMDDEHMGHVFPGGAPVVETVDDHFEHQSDYGGSELYETISQQLLRLGDVPGAISWSFSGNTHATYGTPWPGSVQQKQFSVGGNLNQPTSVVDTAQSTGPASAAAGLQTKS